MIPENIWYNHTRYGLCYALSMLLIINVPYWFFHILSVFKKAGGLQYTCKNVLNIIDFGSGDPPFSPGGLYMINAQ